MANVSVTFDSTLWTFDNDLQVTFDNNGGTDIYVVDVDTVTTVANAIIVKVGS